MPHHHPGVAPPQESVLSPANPTNLNSTPLPQYVAAQFFSLHPDTPPNPSRPNPLKDRWLTFPYRCVTPARQTPVQAQPSHLRALLPTDPIQHLRLQGEPTLLPPAETTSKPTPSFEDGFGGESHLKLGCSSFPIIAMIFYSRIQKLTYV